MEDNDYELQDRLDALEDERKEVVVAARRLMRLCMQATAREALDRVWGEGETESAVTALCNALDIRYP